jgi:mRNA interferase RelE/StbE
MKKIVFTSAATRQWAKLSADIRKRIDAKLTTYATNGSGDVKRLKRRGGCRLRVGHWRVIFIEENAEIIIVAVGNRKEIYD